jgi:hypothetical protein
LSFVHVSDPPVSVATADVSCHQLMHANSLAPDTAAAVVAMPHDVGLGSLLAVRMTLSNAIAI